MKAVQAFLFIAFIYNVFSQAAVATPKYCSRAYTQAFSVGGYTSTLSGVTQCYNGDNSVRANVINFVVSSAIYPDIRVSYLSKKQAAKGSSGIPFVKALIYDQFVEYIESNGIPGYQPVNGTIPGDIVVRVQNLINTARTGGTKWSPVTYSLTQMANINVHTQQFSLQASLPSDIASCAIGLKVAEKEIAIPINGTTTSQLILIPAGIKYTFDLTNIQYSNVNSTGIAIGGHIVTIGPVYLKQSSGTNPPNAQFRLNDCNNEQQSEGAMDTNDNVEGGFHSWRTSFRVLLQNQLQDHGVQLFGPQIVTCPPALTSISSGFICKRVYFSTTSQVQSIDWDPSLGATEAQLNSSSTLTTLASIIMLIAFLML